MSQFFVPGPARIFVGTGSAGALEFLGYTVDGANIAVQPRWDEVFSDLGGPAIPEDIQFLGSDAVIRLTLARYVESVLAKLRAFIRGGTEGSIASYGIGSLLAHEGLAFRLLIVPTYQANKAAYSAQRAAWNFPLTYPVDAIEMPISTRVSLPRISFRAWPEFDSNCLGGYTLYNAVTTGIPAVTC